MPHEEKSMFQESQGNIDDLTWRQMKALKLFEQRPTVYIYNLPVAVGRKTMAQLVAKGIIEPNDPTAGEYSLKYGWKLKQPRMISQRHEPF
jgi:hypothetical protein